MRGFKNAGDIFDFFRSVLPHWYDLKIKNKQNKNNFHQELDA